MCHINTFINIRVVSVIVQNLFYKRLQLIVFMSFCNCTSNAYVIVNATIQGEFIVTVNEPESNTSAWIENDNIQICVKSTTNCIILSEIKLPLKHVTLDNQTKTLSETSSVLMLTNLSKKTRVGIITTILLFTRHQKLLLKQTKKY